MLLEEHFSKRIDQIHFGWGSRYYLGFIAFLGFLARQV
ncbi:hypothetical protein D020_4872 [Vibrio parahaemolyticus SBR10290]|nr:hypothetical protein D052_3340 [Vibrio parahaemolyticus 10290]ETX50279.1 hypothetical protein D020_4872 [Vibrio parahaemolyticus SBR10290]EVU10613.1 hypothetical protein D046_8080 [Vibrio parahaemolyticus V-223/04]